MGKGHELGLINKDDYNDLLDRVRQISINIDRLKSIMVKPSVEIGDQLTKLHSPPIKNPTSLHRLLKRYEICYDDLALFSGWQPLNDSFVKKQVEIEVKYEGYIKRQFDTVKKLKEQEKKKIPANFNYSCIPGLSNELKAKLTKVAPQTLGQMERIPGMTEGAISAVLIMMKKMEVKETTS
jgi:tRNA uridine 5-carboxymethylaminomethyl modification enzyme